MFFYLFQRKYDRVLGRCGCVTYSCSMGEDEDKFFASNMALCPSQVRQVDREFPYLSWNNAWEHRSPWSKPPWTYQQRSTPWSWQKTLDQQPNSVLHHIFLQLQSTLVPRYKLWSWACRCRSKCGTVHLCKNQINHPYIRIRWQKSKRTSQIYRKNEYLHIGDNRLY